LGEPKKVTFAQKGFKVSTSGPGGTLAPGGIFRTEE
jgi:hypothetical protein